MRPRVFAVKQKRHLKMILFKIVTREVEITLWHQLPEQEQEQKKFSNLGKFVLVSPLMS